jgi:heterodisulfide reductase subunit B
MRYLYYPGCSLKGLNKSYEDSMIAVFRALGVELEELEDWNCCGATAYMSIDEMKAFALASRNLALAERQNGNKSVMITPCSGCYLVLSKAQHYYSEYDEVKEIFDKALESIGLNYSGSVKIKHPLDVIVNDIGLPTVMEKVRKPLSGLKIIPYYGCQIVRPYAIFDDAEDPTSLDKLIWCIGGKVIDWPLKTRCCGGSLIGTFEEIGISLSFILLKEAKKRGADVIATVCPLCQFNLESYQREMEKRFNEKLGIPVLFFTQLLGLAFGLSEKELGLNKMFFQVKLV